MKLLISVYLWIHNEYHRGSSVDIGGNEMVFHGVSSMEVNFDELSVAVCAIHNTPVDSVKERENRFQGFPPSLNIFI